MSFLLCVAFLVSCVDLPPARLHCSPSKSDSSKRESVNKTVGGFSEVSPPVRIGGGESRLTVRPNLEVNRKLRYALGMNEIPTIIPERIDDIPLLLEPMQRMGLPTLFDTH